MTKTAPITLAPLAIDGAPFGEFAAANTGRVREATGRATVPVVG